jgi:tetratricopeptide (TPR) repeat protein
MASVHYARRDWDAAAAAYEAVAARGGESWVEESAIYMVGDCHVEAGRPADALPAYGRAMRAALDAGRPLDLGFQAEGVAAALADLGRHAEALEALGAADQLVSAGSRPRDQAPAWGALVERKLAPAREALGPAAADAAYARGASRRLDEALALLLAHGRAT